MELVLQGVYQAFRWWGIGTIGDVNMARRESLSGVPMVGYRNPEYDDDPEAWEFIRRSDGGVSERTGWGQNGGGRVYQAFRWWGIGTCTTAHLGDAQSLSGVPMVGYRNARHQRLRALDEFIRRSDGGVSERVSSRSPSRSRVYQAFRWWGIGT